MKCVVCDDAEARPGSITCGVRHENTLRKWQWRSRRKSLVLDGFVARICPVCKQLVLVDVDNGHITFHVDCAKIAKKTAFSGHKYKSR